MSLGIRFSLSRLIVSSRTPNKVRGDKFGHFCHLIYSDMKSAYFRHIFNQMLECSAVRICSF